MHHQAKVLVIDDEELNLDTLLGYLEGAGYLPIPARNGLEAWYLLQEHSDTGVIVLDRLLPVMDGMALVRKLKADRRFSSIPIIMQTAAANSQQILEGILAGVFYYLPKPYSRDTIVNIVGAALHDVSNALEPADQQESVSHLAQHLRFTFQTIEDVKALSAYAAQCFPDASRALLGLTELMMNAVEHGNLELSFVDKRQLIQNGAWHSEIERRLRLPPYKERIAMLSIDSSPDAIVAIIEDQGAGFDFARYQGIDPARVTDLNGRGIALARILSFDQMEFQGRGSAVRCVTRRHPAENTITRTG